MRNKNLIKAKKEKNDEFYTQYEDIEKEVQHYTEHLKDKVIYCNCDDPTFSNFYKYFSNNFTTLGLKKLITTHYVKDGQSYKLELDSQGIIKTPLNGNGDFRSEECIEILKTADIVITNPPFSLFREFIGSLIKLEKMFLVIGNNNAITYKEIFTHIKNKELWLGIHQVKSFSRPNYEIVKFGNICWFSNLHHGKRNSRIKLTATYDKNAYPTYDDYDGIEVSKVKDIPIDYTGLMGVPITFLDKYNPNQFEIIGLDRYTEGSRTFGQRFRIGNKKKYARIVIKRIET